MTSTATHYRLTNQEWVKLCANLTYAEVKVLMHLRTIDPFADRFKEADTKAISETLQITQRSVQRALCSLATQELIDLEFTGFKFRLRSKLATPTSPDDTHVATYTSLDDTEVATPTSPSDTEIATRDMGVAQTTQRSPKRHPCRDRTSEPLLDNDSGTSHTIHTLQTLKKRERDARERNPKTVENSPPWDEPQTQNSHPEPSPNSSRVEQHSAPPSAQIFNFETFNWGQYDKPGAGGSDPHYFAWAIAQVTQYSDTKAAKGDTPIGDIGRYTLTTIQNRGAAGYLKYLQAQGLAPSTLTATAQSAAAPTPKGLTWRMPTSIGLPTYHDLSDQLAIIAAHLKLKQWGWTDPQLQLWICMAQDTAQHHAWPPIDFQPILGCSNWPDWAIAKLAQDLEAKP